MPSGCIIYSRHFLLFIQWQKDGFIYLHQRGAFDVARFDEQGNASAFTLWNEQPVRLHVFCICF